MASGFGPLGPRIRKTHVNSFQDHAGKPALTVFESSSPLPFLYSFSIYLTHPDASPGNCHAPELYQTITQGPLYGSNVVEFRLDLYFIPSGSQEDCMKHYRAEKNARGSFWAQVDAVGRDERPSDNNTKMPGLVPSYVHDKARYRYHSLIYICDEIDWRGGDQIMTCVEFDPLSREDYEKFSKDPEDPREPDVLPDTDVKVEALSESSPGYGRQLPAPRFSVGSMDTIYGIESHSRILDRVLGRRLGTGAGLRGNHRHRSRRHSVLRSE